jgi:hypothetical protein
MTAVPPNMTHLPGPKLLISWMKPRASRNMPAERITGYRLGCGTK